VCTCGPVPVGAAHASAVVLDPFGGSGTTALVAHALGRRGISIDLSEDYCKLARWRLQDKNAIQAIRKKGTELDDAGPLPVRMAFPANT
jgi:DNA modification methylase